MKYLALSLLVFLLLLQGCGGDKTVSDQAGTFPADSILKRDRMILLLTDVQIAEAALLLNRNRGKERRSDVDYYYAGIFHKYGISRACYLASLKHYQQEPSEFVKMYEVVIQRITDREKNYDPKGRSNLGVNSNRIE